MYLKNSIWPLTYFWKWLSYLPQGASEPDNWTSAIYWSLVSQSQSRQNISISISSSQDPHELLNEVVAIACARHNKNTTSEYHSRKKLKQKLSAHKQGK